MTELNKIVESLHPLERKILKFLKDNATAIEIARQANMQFAEAMKALQFLEAKQAIELNLQKQEIIELDKNGQNYLKKGLPEKRFLKAIEKSPLTLDQIQKQTNLDKNEISISLGLLKKQNLILITKDISITEQGKIYITKETPEEKLLKNLPINSNKLDKETLKQLQKRKQIIKINSKNIYTIKITPLGKKLMTAKIDPNLIDSLTPDLLKTRKWKSKKFRRYDVTVSLGESHTAKRHITAQAINYVKKIWLEMGFQEMTGPIIESSFWNFDALFTPQDHPAREMQDTFFIEGKSKLPDKELVKEVKKIHESEWKYKWEEEIAKEKVLRTHTTPFSVRTLSKLKLSELPAKFFSVNRVFRNEAMDWSHLFELTQVEGIVVDPNANFRDLIGYLKQFYKKLGFEKIRVRPGYFAYVEPGLEVDGFHPIKKKWVELGGAGIFRPEVVIPLRGKDIPVLAWGQGFERGISEYYQISDIRHLYKNDLKELRQAKMWLK